MSKNARKASQIPLKLDYDRRAMRHEYTKLLNKRFNTESDDSDYEQQNIKSKMEQDAKGSSRRKHGLVDRAMKQL